MYETLPFEFYESLLTFASPRPVRLAAPGVRKDGIANVPRRITSAPELKKFCLASRAMTGARINTVARPTDGEWTMKLLVLDVDELDDVSALDAVDAPMRLQRAARIVNRMLKRKFGHAGLWFCSGRAGLHCWVGYVANDGHRAFTKTLKHRPAELFTASDVLNECGGGVLPEGGLAAALSNLLPKFDSGVFSGQIRLPCTHNDKRRKRLGVYLAYPLPEPSTGCWSELRARDASQGLSDVEIHLFGEHAAAWRNRLPQASVMDRVIVRDAYAAQAVDYCTQWTIAPTVNRLVGRVHPVLTAALDRLPAIHQHRILVAHRLEGRHGTTCTAQWVPEVGERVPLAIQALCQKPGYDAIFSLIRSLAWSHQPLAIFVGAYVAAFPSRASKFRSVLRSIMPGGTCSSTASAHSYVTGRYVVQTPLSALMIDECNAALRACGGVPVHATPPNTTLVPTAAPTQPAVTTDQRGRVVRMKVLHSALESILFAIDDAKEHQRITRFAACCVPCNDDPIMVMYKVIESHVVGPGGARGRTQWLDVNGTKNRLGSLNSEIRRQLLETTHCELDFSKSHWRILQSCCRRANTPCASLDVFLTDPAAIFEKIGGNKPSDRAYALLTKEEPAMYGIAPTGVNWARQLLAERPQIKSALYNHPLCAGHGEETMSVLMQHVEDRCLATAIEAMEGQGFATGVTINDSVYVERCARPIENAIAAAERVVRDAHGINVVLRVSF